jgi:hypothetical protein
MNRFDTIENVVDFYKSNSDMHTIHKTIYKTFENNAIEYNNNILLLQYVNTPGFGYIAFSWNWYLLVNSMPSQFTFLEIGVYKGRILALIQLLSTLLNKTPVIYGISPLDTTGDKYSKYDVINYLDCINESFSKFNLSLTNTKLIKGLSQDEIIIKTAKQQEPYDIIFIDGCHDYDIVCLDIQNYSNMVKVGGYLVLDDASSLLPYAYGGDFLGHDDVGKAVNDILVKDTRFVHLYAVGHNRVWKRLS